MRNFTLRSAFAGIVLCSSLLTTAQKASTPPAHRCGTMEVLNKIIQDDPSIVKKWQSEGQKQYQAYLQRKEDQSGQRVVNGEIIIPVVFHLVGASNILNVISDRDIYDQLEILNRDFSGQKAEHYKASGIYAPQFAAAVGNIPVRFVLARRTPAGTATSGIERLVTTKVFGQLTVDELKSTSDGGLDPWDVSKYLNIWCGSFTDLLGIATFPFTNSPTIGPQGVAIDLGTLGANPCRGYYAPQYSEGATLSHEVGHFFYLWHTFGDMVDCNNRDFRIQSGWPLTTAATIDDTPPEQTVESTMYGNLGGIYSDGCATNPPGIMYMNFMNYYDDRSLFIFTKGQKERVTATLDMYRSSLRDSDADLPPAPTTDAYLVSLSPGGNCVERLPVLNNTPLKATIRNYGTTTLTSITVTVQVNGGAVVPATFPISLAPGKDTTLEVGTISGARGNQNIAVAVTAPNGGTDAYPHNDNLTTNVNIRDNYLTAPFTETFSGTFPPQRTTANDLWYVNGNYGTNTWSKSDAAFNTKGAVVASNYEYNEHGLFDELITPPIDFTTFDTSVLSFKVAYARYGDVTNDWDGLEVHASNDGGQSWMILYKKTGTNLQTQTAATGDLSFDPGTAANLWRTERINLTPYIANGEKLILKFRNVNAYGNNIFIDDIGVTAISRTGSNAALTAIKDVPPALCNEFSIKPVVTIINRASVELTTVKVNYRIDNGAVTTVAWNGSLAGNMNADVALGTIANLAAGPHTLTVYTSEPNNSNDEDKSNDTARARFTIFTQANAPITQGFESTTFPSDGWGVAASGTGPTWDRNTHASTEGVASVWVQNFKSIAGQVDRLFSPIIKTATYDSAYIRFDVAHATAVLPTSTTLPMDTLEVLVTTDCGATYTSVYKKWGAELQTMGNPNFVPQYDRVNDLIGFIPNSATWRNEFLNITAIVTGKPEFQVIFKNSSNEGNNTFLDNINIYTVLLPERLKKEGYIVYPNPFSGSFTIRHLQIPTGLKGLTLVGASGQVVYQRNYNGNATQLISIDGSRLSNGVYTLRMVYNDKVVTQRIIKRPY